MDFKHYLNETTRRQKLRHSLHNIRTRDLTMGIVSPENPMVKIPFKFEDRFLKKKKAQKTLKEGRLNEGTSNFDYDHRCVVVTDEDYEMDNVPAVDHDKDYGSRSYPRYPLADYGTETFAVTLNPGYYEAACIDYCPKNSDYTDVKWYAEAAGKEYTAQMENRDPDEGDALDWYDIDPEELLEVNEQEYFESAKNIELAAHQLEKTIEKKFRDEEVEVNKQIDEIMEEYGYDEYGVSARFSNGETMYSKINRKKTNESAKRSGKMLRESDDEYVGKQKFTREELETAVEELEEKVSGLGRNLVLTIYSDVNGSTDLDYMDFSFKNILEDLEFMPVPARSIDYEVCFSDEDETTGHGLLIKHGKIAKVY